MAETVKTGLWYLAGQNRLKGWTLTLPTIYGRFLLSGLQVLVTISGSFFWTIVCLLIHRLLLRRGKVDALDLQQQVVIRNSSSALGSAWQLFKISWAWGDTNARRVLRRSWCLILSALICSILFAVAAICVPLLASNVQDQTLVLMKGSRCGILLPDSTTNKSFISSHIKSYNDMSRGRAISNDARQNASTSRSRTIFPFTQIPYTFTTNATCPVSNWTRCSGGRSGSSSISTGALDSFKIFGINDQPSNRVTFEKQTTCSPVDVEDLKRRTWDRSNPNFPLLNEDIYMGNGIAENYTFRKPLHSALAMGLYGIDLRYHSANASSFPVTSIWTPTREFLRLDADMIAIFMSADGIAYNQKVLDPFFLATDWLIEEKYVSDRWTSVMVCVEQYRLCNPTTSACTSLNGGLPTAFMVDEEVLNLNPAQRVAAVRLMWAAQESSLLKIRYISSQAFLASQFLLNHVSFGLPENQWQLEFKGWFETSLVAMQSLLLEYASAPDPSSIGPYMNLSPGAEALNAYPPNSSGYTEFIKAGQNQCNSQLIRSIEGVINFNFSGVLIVVVLSAVLILMGLFLESCLTCFVKKRYQWESVWRKARVADDQLHLLRMALDGARKDIPWNVGKDGQGIPRIKESTDFPRPEENSSVVGYRVGASSQGLLSGAVGGNSQV